jgi:hypothetical protein
MISIATKEDERAGGSEGSGALLENAGEIVSIARQQLAGAGEIVKNAVNNQPVAALAAALATGVLLGWLIKRR